MSRSKKDSDQCSRDEAGERLVKALRGAFSGSPTPLKDIPKKGGESRAKKKPLKPAKGTPKKGT